MTHEKVQAGQLYFVLHSRFGFMSERFCILFKYYIRYADDFVMLHRRRDLLEAALPAVREFLSVKLKLALHEDKVGIKTFASGVDFLGWVHFPDHRVLRTATRRRMVRRLSEMDDSRTTDSYLGLLKHGNTYTLRAKHFPETAGFDISRGVVYA